MRKYEMIFVLQADEPETELEARVTKAESIITAAGGEISERNHWGVRHLAYEIQHETRGNYMHLLFRTTGDAIAELDGHFRLDHKVLRHLIVVDEEWKERNEANRAKRRRHQPAAAVPAEAPAPVVEATPEAPAPVEPTPPASEDAPEPPAEQ